MAILENSFAEIYLKITVLGTYLFVKEQYLNKETAKGPFRS